MSKINRIDGALLAKMMISGANNLYNHKDEVDELNVFPVPDGDTGTNMSLTSRAMAEELMQMDEKKSVSEVADKMSFATLRGARGNSGVILSQIFRGFSKSLKGMDECSAADFAKALHEGAMSAYKAVMKPTEGTILTVSRVSGEACMLAATEDRDISSVLGATLKKANEALENTPELLPALKEAGVVDAGGQGFCYILDGAYQFLLTGSIVTASGVAADSSIKRVKPKRNVDTSEIKFMYCTEFIIERNNADIDVDEMRALLSSIGDCMLVIDDEKIIKVHVHTNTPGTVLDKAVLYGELTDIKIDNMKYQHKSILDAKPKMKVTTTNIKKPIKTATPKKEYGFVAVSVGRGLSDILKDLGVDKIIEGGQTMNPSTNDILRAINHVEAKNVFVFPNNKNIVMAATQAGELSEKNVIVIPTVSIPQCITALLKFDASRPVDANELNMNKAMRTVKSAQITYAVRDTEYEGRQIKKGDILGILEGKIYAIGTNPESVCEKLIEKMCDDDSEFITVYSGKNTSAKNSAEMLERLTEKYDDFEVSMKKGGQPLYYYIISVE